MIWTMAVTTVAIASISRMVSVVDKAPLFLARHVR